MTPIEHALIGASSAAIAENICDLKISRKTLYWMFILSSMAPDIDFITIINRAYYENRINNIFLSHRGITHSIFGVAIIALFFVLVYYLKTKSKEKLKIVLLITFIGGFLHIVCDLFNPSFIWDGIPFFFPLRFNGDWWRIGGWNKIGWYDYVIMYSLILGLVCDFIVRKIVKVDKARRILVLFIYSIIFIVISLHILNSHYLTGVDFYTAQTAWHNSQLESLPDWLVNVTDAVLFKGGIFLFYVLPKLVHKII